MVALSKTDLVDATGRERIRDAVKAIRPKAVVVDAPHGQVPAALLFPEDPDHAPAPRETRPQAPDIRPVRDLELDI